MTEAGKEALMWGMVGGVVVQPEDLEKGGEELLARLKGETPAETPVAEPPARVDFYQADKTVTVSVYEKGLIPADVRVEFEARQVRRFFLLSPPFPFALANSSSLLLCCTHAIVVRPTGPHPPPYPIDHPLPSLRTHQRHHLLLPSLARQDRAHAHEVAGRPSMGSSHYA